MRGRLDPNLSGGFHRGRLTTPQTPSQQPANRFPSPFTLDNSPQTTDWRRTAHISQNSYHNPCWISKSNTGIPSYTQYTSKWWCSTRGEGCLRLSGSAAQPLRTTVQKRLNEIVVEWENGRTRWLERRADRDGVSRPRRPPRGGSCFSVTPHLIHPCASRSRSWKDHSLSRSCFDLTSHLDRIIDI